ncbi:MAG: TIR domain-containing protein [Candidatus Brocadiia bacterium]
MSLVDTLKELVERGKELLPHAGSLVRGYNGNMQPDYVSWRLQAISAINELGKQAQPLLKEIDSDKKGSYFYDSSLARVLGVLKAALAIAQRQSAGPAEAAVVPKQDSDRTAATRALFIVHGHDQALLQQVARFVEKLDIKPVILFEVPGKGQTVIEKLESNSDVPFAIVLLTPDDIGRAAKKGDELHPRARQNVVLELGYFLGKLGRPNVAALYDESVELPSDYRGVDYVKIDAEGAWKLKLAKELKAAGLPVDMNKAI